MPSFFRYTHSLFFVVSNVSLPVFSELFLYCGVSVVLYYTVLNQPIAGWQTACCPITETQSFKGYPLDQSQRVSLKINQLHQSFRDPIYLDKNVEFFF